MTLPRAPGAQGADEDAVEKQRIAVLDHGYVELVDAMGSDESIIEAAR